MLSIFVVGGTFSKRVEMQKPNPHAKDDGDWFYISMSFLMFDTGGFASQFLFDLIGLKISSNRDRGIHWQNWQAICTHHRHGIIINWMEAEC